MVLWHRGTQWQRGTLSMLGATPDSDSPLTSLLARLRTDQDRGALLSLEEYWELFPGEAEVIAREYLALTEEGTAPSSSTSAARIQAT